MQHTEHHLPPDRQWSRRRGRLPFVVLLAVASLGAMPVIASTSVDAASTVAIAQFPAQGPCTFTDTFGAVRPGGTAHLGVDIIATTGRKVYAVDDGTLTQQTVVATNQLSGNSWRLTRADGTYFFFAHLSAFASGLKVGSKVTAGQIIGAVGATGNAGTPHLHFEVHPGGGTAVDPTPIVQRVDGCTTSVVPVQPTTTTLPPPPAIDKWNFVNPVTAFDTTGHPRLAAGSTTTVKVNALAGVPSTASGVMVRIIARNITRGGNLVLHACGTTSRATTLTLVPAQLAATTTLVKTSGGSICATTSVVIDLRVDVVGYVAASGAGLRPVAARRALDTRRSAPLAANATIAASGTALGVVSGDKAVTVTITLVNAMAAGSLGIGPCGGTPWIVPFPKAVVQVFSAVVRTAGSDLCVSSTQTVQVVIDVTGVWTGASGVVPIGPTRVFDSRPSLAITTSSVKVPVSLPAGATRAQLSITMVGGAVPGVLFAWPCALGKPAASVGSVRARSLVTIVMSYDSTHGGLCMASNGRLHLVVDAAAVG